jgi:hypothetical protein
MRHLTYLLIWLLVIGSSSAEPMHWEIVSDGFDVASGDYRHRDPIRTAHLTAVRLDQSKFAVRIATNANETARGTGQILTLRAFSSDPHVVAGINGSYVTSYAFPKSVGLARAAGVTIAPYRKTKLLSGALCVSESGILRIVAATVAPGAECFDALQSGPMLIEQGGQNGIADTEPAARVFDRSAMCIDNMSRVVFLHAEKTSLFDLAEFARASDADGGLGCRTAINLSGDTDSGVFWRAFGTLHSVGSIDASEATAVIAKKK